MSGAEGLLSIGAIEFLSHLRQDVDPELHRGIDSLIHQLLSLPQDDAVDHNQQCLYKDHNPGVIESIQTSVNHSEKDKSYGGCRLKPVHVVRSWVQFPSWTQKFSLSHAPGGSSSFHY